MDDSLGAEVAAVKPTLAVLLVGLLLGIPMELSELGLPDQHGNQDSLAAHRGNVVVAMVVTARRLRNLKGWERDLRARFEEVDFVRVADVPEDPPVTYRDVADKLATRVPEEVAVLIDIDRRWSSALDLDTGRPNLLLIDADGRLVASFRGRAEPALVDEVASRIEELLRDP
jgi:hypothetical protein